MVNKLREGDNLEPVEYSSLLKKISDKLSEHTLFKVSSDRLRLRIDIDTIAASVSTTTIENPLTTTKGVRAATVNFRNKDNFQTQIGELKDNLISRLKSQAEIENVADFVDSLTVNLTDFQGKCSQLGLFYPFDEEYTDLQKNKLILNSEWPGSDSLLKFHKLTITVGNIGEFQSQLEEGIKRNIQENFDSDDDEDIEDLYNVLKKQVDDKNSDFNQLQRLVDEETLGKLKKEAKIIYLEHLFKEVESDNKPGVIYLKDLIRRLRLIEEYINDDSKADSHYDVYYAGEEFNYRDIFARAEAFDSLPIIPIIEGTLGETTNKETGETQFILGLKMKLDGKVQARGRQEVFEYNLEIITQKNQQENDALAANPDQKNTGARKILTRAFLYYFVFSCPNPKAESYQDGDELNYDPVQNFDERVLPILRKDNDAEKDKIFRGFVRGLEKYGVQKKIKKLRGLIKEILDRKKKLPNCRESRQICINKRILKTDPNDLYNEVFFHDDLRQNYKKCLRYIFLVREGINNRAVCQLPAEINIEDICYFEGDDRQSFEWKYDVEGIKALPIMWIPDTEPCWQRYRENFVNEKYKLILFNYKNQRFKSDENQLNATQAFIYRFTWALLSYLCLHILLEKYSGAEKKLFIPMVRLHEGTHENPFPVEKFLANLSKILAFIFSNKYRCNSQGFQVEVNQKPPSYKIRNGLNSLYSVLPKKFTPNNNSDSTPLDKLAIMIVSSRVSDSRTGSQNRHNRIANLLGEVISIERSENGSVKVQPLTTFFDNYSQGDMYEEPPILIDTVSELYSQGYRHFLYVAQAPYTSRLHITQQEDNERLYFMSPAIIKGMNQNRDDIKIYPVLFDKYYVRRLKKQGIKSLYIQDTRQLTSIAEDSTQESVVFFNLLNSISVGGKKTEDERFYNGVISYSTLLGKYYSGVMDDEDIRQGLVYEGSLKNDILQYLTFFHFSRYEKQENKSNQNFKLNPYENIIGDQALGSLANFPQMTENIDFNALAFLTEVDKVFNVLF